MKTGDIIRSAIEQRQMTQKATAMRLGISETYLSDILNGKRAVSAYVAVRLERVLGLDASTLYYRQAMSELQEARRNFK